MIEVILHRDGIRISNAEDMETPEQALLAARTLWDDEEYYGRRSYADRRRYTLYFLVDDVLSFSIAGRRP